MDDLLFWSMQKDGEFERALKAGSREIFGDGKQTTSVDLEDSSWLFAFASSPSSSSV